MAKAEIKNNDNKPVQPVKEKKVKNKKPAKERRNIIKRIAGKFREVVGELKKVTWPSFNTVVKKTSVVIGVILFFLVVLFIFEYGLSELFELLTKAF